LGREFHRVIVDGKKECKYVSVLAKMLAVFMGRG